MNEEKINELVESRKNGRVYGNIITSLWRWGFENHDDEYRHTDDLVWSDPEERYILDDDARRLCNDEFCHYENAVELYDGNYAYSEWDDLVRICGGEHDGEYAIADDDENIIRDYEGEYIWYEDAAQITDGFNRGEYVYSDDALSLSEKYYDYADESVVVREDIVTTPDGDIILSHDAVKVDGKWYHKDYAPEPAEAEN